MQRDHRRRRSPMRSCPGLSGTRTGAGRLMLWPFYRWAIYGLSPVISLYLSRRASRGKEDRTRLGERWGRPGLPRPAGPLVWLHAASVGEALSLLPLVGEMLTMRDDLNILVTTGTVSSAKMMAERLPKSRALHQFVPIDHPVAARRFLRLWRPDLDGLGRIGTMADANPGNAQSRGQHGPGQCAAVRAVTARVAPRAHSDGAAAELLRRDPGAGSDPGRTAAVAGGTPCNLGRRS